MKKSALILLFLALPFSTSASLWQFYTENGQMLPSVAKRAVIAAQYGIIGYRGIVAQNNILESILRGEKRVGFSVATDFQKTLRAGMTSSQNYFYPSNLTLKDGTTLTMAALGEKVFFTLEPGGSREEIVMCTGIDTANTKITSCTRGLGFSGTSTAAVTGNAKAHNSGSIVVMSNVHYVYEQYVDTNYKTQVINGPKTFASSTVTIGDGTTTDNKCWSIYNGDANQPKLCYVESVSKFYIYNDGVNSYDLTSSGSGLAAGIGISITGSQIIFAPAPTSTSGLGFLGNKAIVATSTSDASILNLSDGLAVATSSKNYTWGGIHTFNGTQTKFNYPINTSSTIYSSPSATSTFVYLGVERIGTTSTLSATTTFVNDVDIKTNLNVTGYGVFSGNQTQAGVSTFSGGQTKFTNGINASSTLAIDGTITSYASTSSTIPMLNVGRIGATSTQATTTVMNNLEVTGNIKMGGQFDNSTMNCVFGATSTYAGDNGVQTITHNLNYTPSLIEVFMITGGSSSNASASHGWGSTASNEVYAGYIDGGASSIVQSGTGFIYKISNDTVGQTGALTALTSTTFQLTITPIGSGLAGAFTWKVCK